jgi:hypothetical protein
MFNPYEVPPAAAVHEAADLGVYRDDIDIAMRNGALRYVRSQVRRKVSPSALREFIQWMNTGGRNVLGYKAKMISAFEKENSNFIREAA